MPIVCESYLTLASDRGLQCSKAYISFWSAYQTEKEKSHTSRTGSNTIV